MKYLPIVASAVTALSASVVFGQVCFETKTAVRGSYFKAVMWVPHGCDGDATDTVRVRIPEGMIAVKLKLKSGWDVETIIGTYQNTYDLHGRAVTEGVVELIWRGSLPGDWFDEFVFLGKISDSVPVGTPLYFPTTQRCKAARIDWIEVPDTDQDRHDLKRPAPVLNIGPKGHATH
mgnify:FL=1